MDDFGVLVKHYGINPKGKSAPMAASKKAPKTQNSSDFVNQDPNFFPQSFSKSNSGGGSVFVDQNDDIFGFNSGHKGQSNVSGDVFDDFFQIPTQSSGMCTRGSDGGGGGGGVGFDMESVFKGSVDSGAKSSGVNGGDDDIWGFSENSSTNTNVGVGVGSNGDLLSSDPVDDFWGKMAKLSLDQRGVKRLGENKVGNDDLIPGFDGSFTVNNTRAQTSAKEKDPGVSSLEELENFATRKINNDTNGNGASFTVKNPRKTVNHKPDETNFFDFDVSVGGSSVQKEKMENVDILFQTEPIDLDSFFPSQTKKSTPISENSAMNTNTYKEPDLFSGNAFGTDKKVSSGVFPDDFMFEGSSATEAFQEIKGESDERRNLRFARHQRAKARMENALAEMNEREFKAQQEQEEKHRIADAMSVEMKRWAAGKEGNLRALLSSLQQVLGPEFGWRPVSITDLITSSQVKIAYKKAALCIHPDKVQQRGANLEQKFVAEKAFDLLKEAWNKFSSEELR